MKKPLIMDAAGIFPDWLRSHPDLQPWERGRERLEEQTGFFIEFYVPSFYDTHRGSRPFREGSQLCERLLSCWVYHWKRGGVQWDFGESLEYLRNRLPFCPLRDIVFSEAIYDRQNLAARCFQEQIAPYLKSLGERLLRILRFTNDVDSVWENTFWVFLLEEPEGRSSVLLRYMGLVPIQNWLAIVFTNHVNNQWRKRMAQCKETPMKDFSTRASSSRTTEVEEVWIQGFIDFLREQLQREIAQLDAESRMRLEYTYGENLSNQEVAAILHELPPTTSRRRLVIEERLGVALRTAIQDSESWREYADIFNKNRPSMIMKWMFGRE
ncbi:MAG: hypothetical protein Q4D98_11635 [Planctomycetia bacterium]|nr:hypothetical protein [Planctomycetia bacterium]